MHLRSIHLINWRSYRNARFEFPRPHGDKNVILVMAPNEHGKTSFFEALTLGLFGRDGLRLLPRARADGGGDDRLKASYSQFLAASLHWRAKEAGPTNCAVTLEWEDESGEPIEIRRIWHFRNDGLHKPADDELLIFAGLGRKPIAPPAAEEDRDGWYRDWIAQRFIYSSFAEFFLFDGEQVQRYASRGMSGQVRSGIEGLLGLPILRSLKESLASYAQTRRTSAAAPSDSTVKKVEADIATAEEEIDEKKRILDEADATIPDLEYDVTELTQRLGGRGEGTMALVATLHQDETRFRDDAQKAISSLTELIAGDVALAVAGVDLRRSTIERLEAEAKRENWEAGRTEGNRKLDAFADDLANRVSKLAPPLDEHQRDGVVSAAKGAWAGLWHPAPHGCADDYLHTALSGADRLQTIDRLEIVDRHSSDELSGLIERFGHSLSTAEAKKRERLELERNAPEDEVDSQKLAAISERLGVLRENRKRAEVELDALSARLSDHRAELGRHMSKIGASEPALRRASYADAYAALIEDLLKEAVPNEVGEVAEEMTKAWKAMAHMSDRVDRIEISPTCEVRMLNVNGEDLHAIDKSAGASQVFTQALITAITKVSRRTFPFVVDTPLARLSREQRLGVLKTFTDRTGQVVLLSTDEEVVGDKLDAIRDRVSAAYELKVTQDKGVAVTTVHDLDLRAV